MVSPLRLCLNDAPKRLSDFSGLAAAPAQVLLGKCRKPAVWPQVFLSLVPLGGDRWLESAAREQ
jgi:hypothetical protein